MVTKVGTKIQFGEDWWVDTDLAYIYRGQSMKFERLWLEEMAQRLDMEIESIKNFLGDEKLIASYEAELALVKEALKVTAPSNYAPPLDMGLRGITGGS